MCVTEVRPASLRPGLSVADSSAGMLEQPHHVGFNFRVLELANGKNASVRRWYRLDPNHGLLGNDKLASSPSAPSSVIISRMAQRNPAGWPGAWSLSSAA